MKIIVTAGPTREHLDPVRYLSNPSTGKMGFAIAKASVEKGFDTILVTGPVSLKTPKGVKRVDVVSAREMYEAVKAVDGADLLVATAAVADWRPAKCAKEKLKKNSMKGTIELVRNPDILKSLKGMRKIGFAAETQNVLEEATRKCREKDLEFIVANDVSEKGCGFGSNDNRVTIIRRDGTVLRLPKMSKLAVARRIIKEVCRGA